MHLVSLWEGPVSWLERLCVTSMLEAGHKLTIYSYKPDDLRHTSLHDNIRDAREIMGEDHISYRYIGSKRYNLFANIFRVELQTQEKGIWFDLDCFQIQPLKPSLYTFGWVSHRKLNNAVLGLPAKADMTKDYLKGISAIPLRTPWSTWRRRTRRDIEILLGKDIPHISVRSNIGPRALTYYAQKHNVISEASSPEVFFPIPSKLASILVSSNDTEANSRITENTIVAHAWQGKLKRSGLLDDRPPASSFLGKACKNLNI